MGNPRNLVFLVSISFSLPIRYLITIVNENNVVGELNSIEQVYCIMLKTYYQYIFLRSQTMTDYMTVREIANELRISVSTVIRLYKSKKISGIKVGKQIRIRRKDFQHFLDSCV